MILSETGCAESLTGAEHHQHQRKRRHWIILMVYRHSNVLMSLVFSSGKYELSMNIGLTRTLGLYTAPFVVAFTSSHMLVQR